MGTLRRLVSLLWRILRYLGLGALIVPLAGMGLVWFGMNVWTVAAVVVAVAVALGRPAVAAGLLPAAMIGTGICGLVKAAAPVPRTAYFVLIGRVLKHGKGDLNVAATVAPSGHGTLSLSFGKGGEVTLTAPKGRFQLISGPPSWAPGHNVYAVVSPPHFSANYPAAFWAAHAPGLGPVSSPWWGRALVALSLLLLAIGLWLTPRVLGRLRGHTVMVAPYLLRRIRENYWGILLVPAAAFGLSVFGVHAWTVSLVVAAAVITAVWPAVAADLVPAALVGFAVCGYMITVSWQTLTLGANRPSELYGLVVVTSRSLALLAGAEASVLLALAAWLVPRTIGAHARALAMPDVKAELAGRVERLTETRSHAIDSATAELMRIERDLHDGAQARLVALGMNLRALERMIPDSPQAALALAVEARQTSARALSDLRDLVRGIYPPVLADRGLTDAVEALALEVAIPVELDIDLPGRLTTPVEAACYFAVAEVLANAVKHAGARQVHVRIGHDGEMLRIEVADDGIGGADTGGGTGLRGVERRLGTFDGILAVSSPLGGPTMIAMEVPCALSSPKTCSC
ncbi:MAG TPA: histidine kinase [Streptosporangiaceae bacterium]|jgi:signal transduction histidine kinase|nr:histidine kinase [Streptosporangiaceae bacterium]